MNLDELRAVQNKERQKDSLQHLRESFYADVAEWVSELEEQRNTAAREVEDPFASPEVRQLTDEIQTARDVTEAIYQRRLGKLVKRASLAAADMPTDAEGLTKEEQRLHDDLVDRIVENKDRVLDVVAGAADAPVPDGSTDDEAAAPTGASAAEVMGAGGSAEGPASGEASNASSGDSNDPGADPAPDTDEIAGTARDPAPEPPTPTEEGDDADVADDESATPDETAGIDDRTTVRITDDVGEIFGVDDRAYELSAEDVVTLPAANAEPLLERDAAERVE